MIYDLDCGCIIDSNEIIEQDKDIKLVYNAKMSMSYWTWAQNKINISNDKGDK